MKWSFYREDTGKFISRVGSYSNDDDVVANTPAGCIAIQGEFDHLAERFDIESSEVVPYIPAQPDLDHEWNESRRRWVKKVAVQVIEANRADTLQKISQLEQRQARRVRELLAESDPRLKALDEEIETLRVQLQQPPGSVESSGSVQPAAGSPREA